MGIFGNNEAEKPDETKDPILGGNIQDGEGDNGAEKPETKHEPEGKANVTETIGQRLSQQEAGEDKGEQVLNPENPLPLDLSKLTTEQLQTLKSMLAATPDRVQRKKKNPTVKLRVIDGKVVMDFKNAYKALVDDPENNRKVERTHIQVKLQGEEKYHSVLYRDFMQAKQVVCEIVSTRQDKDEIVEGETISRETGRPVEMIVTVVKDFFTIKLPDGSTVEIEGRLANA